MNYIKKKTSYLLVIAACCFFCFSSCQKESSYFKDSGLANPYFKGTVMDYLKAKPFYFDSVALVEQLSGLDTILDSEIVTFFAPTDRSIMRLIRETNDELYLLQYDTIRTLSDVPANIWRKYMSRYIFHGANQLRDYPQVDYELLVTYPGQGYLSWDGIPMNIGVVYNDQNGIKYVGYRQLTLAYIPDISNPTDNWNIAYVASSNILTDNGVVHVLSDDHTYFGFNIGDFISDMEMVMSNGGTVQ